MDTEYSVNSTYITNGGHDIIEEVTTDEDDGLLQTESKVLIRAPKDKYKVVYIIFCFLGVTSMLPWNFFITANDYWMYKFRNVTDNITSDPTAVTTKFQKLFTSYLCLASVVPNTVFLILNTYFAHRVHHQIRLTVSLAVITSLFIYTTILVKVDTDCWQEAFFIMTISAVVVNSIFSAVQQGGMFGVVGNFPSHYMVGTVSGQALGGIFAAITSIGSIAIGASYTTSALIYFVIADIVLFLCLVSYFFVVKLDFFTHYVVDGSNTVAINCSKEEISVENVSQITILKKTWLYQLTVLLTFMVTLSIFPSISVLVMSQNSGHGYLWNDVYFTPVVCFLEFNVGDFLGRIIGGKLKWPRKGSLLLLIFSILRIGFIPLFMFCNVQPRSIPYILFPHDFHFVIIMAAFALSNGYLGSLMFAYTPQVVTREEQETASSMLASALGIGVCIGIFLSTALVTIV